MGPATQRDAAERTLSTAQKLQANAPDTLLAQAYFQYWVLRDYEAAKVTFGLVRKMLPGSSEVPKALARITRRQGHWDESIAYCKQSLALDPLNFDSLTECGATYRMLRQFPAALNIYDRALTTRPNDPYTLACEAELYQAQGDLEQAGKLLAGVPANTWLAGILPRINQLILERHYGEAIRLLEATLTEFARRVALGWIGKYVICRCPWLWSSSWHTIVQAREPLLKRRSARWKRSAKRNQITRLLVALLSQTYAVLGEKDAALREAERAVMLLPSAQDAVSGPMFEENLARVQVRCGEKDRSISALQRLLLVPYGYTPLTPALLRLDPMFDPLRNDPRFQKLCEEKQP